MRIFIGIDFNDVIIKLMESTITKLIDIAEKGRFVRSDLLHLTVEFLGEIEAERLSELQEIIEGIKFEPFYIRPSGFSSFKKREGDIFWIGIEENQDLRALREKLHKTLSDAGFIGEDQPYVPHITLGRKVKITSDIKELESRMAQEMPESLVDCIHIFHSTSKNGRLEYIKIYSGKIQK